MTKWRSSFHPVESANNLRKCRAICRRLNYLCNINDLLAERKGFELTVRLPLAVRCKKASGVNYTAISATQCRSNPVPVRRLPETGIFHISAGDYRRIRAASCQIGSPEIVDRLAKETINRENISRNREFLAGNREFHLEKRGIRFSVHTGHGSGSYPDVTARLTSSKVRRPSDVSAPERLSKFSASSRIDLTVRRNFPACLPPAKAVATVNSICLA